MNTMKKKPNASTTLKVLQSVHTVLSSVPSQASSILAAVSGGSDSVTLLLALRQTLPEPAMIHVAHLNHQLRGEESDADQQFVEQICEKLNVQRHVKSMNVQELANQQGENLESMARRLRYDWFLELAQEFDIPLIATGHTADDQAETVLHRLIRGTGFQGLSGIARQRELAPNKLLIRPLIEVTRREIEAFLDEQSQSAREDSSNADVQFTRNRIRHELLPLLTEYNPAIRDVLCRLANQASETYHEEEREAMEALHQCEKPKAGSVIILELARLQTFSRFRCRSLFRFLWMREHWPRGAMGREHWNRLESLVHDEQNAADFPGRIRARRCKNVLQVGTIDAIEQL